MFEQRAAVSGAYDASSKTIVVYRDPGDSITVPITSINSAPAYDTEAHGQWLALIINPERFGCTVQLTTREVLHCSLHCLSCGSLYCYAAV